MRAMMSSSAVIFLAAIVGVVGVDRAHAAPDAPQIPDSVSGIRAPSGTEGVILWGHVAAAVMIVLVCWKKGFFRAGGLSRGRRANEHPWFLYFACGIMVWLSFSLAAAAGAGISGVSLGQMLGSVKAQAVVLLCGYGASLAVGCILVRLVRTSAPESGLGLGAKGIRSGLGGGLLAWPIVTSIGLGGAFVHHAVTGEAPDKIAHETLRSLIDHRGSPWAWTLAALAVFAAPVQEEIIYRGFGQTAVLGATGRPWVAVLGVSLLFAAVHTTGPQPVPWHAAAAIFALSVCMGIAFERSRNLLTPIIMHIMFNGANVGLALMS